MYGLPGFQLARIALAAFALSGMAGRGQTPPTPVIPNTGPNVPGEAQTFNGVLVDTECRALQQSPAGCEISSTTRAFGLQLRNGTVLRLDPGGNDKVRAALQNGPKQPGPVTCTVRGVVQGGVLTVQSIEIPQA